MTPRERHLARKIRARIDAAFAADEEPIAQIMTYTDWSQVRRQIARSFERSDRLMEQLTRDLEELRRFMGGDDDAISSDVR